MNRKVILLLALLSAATGAKSQEFFNLTEEEVRIDSILPVFTHQFELGPHYADSAYEVRIVYPEFIDMSASDVARYGELSGESLPELPRVEQYVGVERKRGRLAVSFVPLVERQGRLQKLVSFKLELVSRPLSSARRSARAEAQDVRRYAAHSVLSQGTWAKIRVSETGIHQLTDALIRKAGFSDPSKVKVYGYGGALQPETLTGDYLAATDDLKEVPTLTVGGRRLFYAVGPVTWSSPATAVRTRNYCSDYGYYFLTESDAEPLTVDSLAFAKAYYPSNSDYHSLAEQDGYAWYHSGRNLYNATALSKNKTQAFELESPSKSGRLVVSMSYNGYCSAAVLLNGQAVDTIEVNAATVKAGVNYFGEKTTYSSMASDEWAIAVDSTLLKVGKNTVELQQLTGIATMRTDWVSLTFDEPRPMPQLSRATLPVPEYVYRITHQDHHADPQAQMVIIIPTSQKLLAQAERLKALHEQHDSLTVTIVPADELYNEFSSGTPDVTAYRRYLKMLYDRAQTDDDMPRYLLLMGDGAWDNRMRLSQWRSQSADDFLLCYESENSFSQTKSYVNEDFFGLLDDEESATSFRSKPDIGIGRIPARTAERAKAVVDKICDYVANEQAGSWQNTICIMADDGNSNQHMGDAESIAAVVADASDGYLVKKVYWDAYPRVASSTGNRYPEVERQLKQQMADGALIMNYSGHGAAYCISHEQVLQLDNFKQAVSQRRLPLWLTASCDIAPFDTQEENIGEEALFNPNGGAIAFIGTARTVFMTQNRQINRAFTKHVLSSVGGKLNTIGDALRLAKNELVNSGTDTSQNKLHYVLLGDPALALALPTGKVVIDSIDGKPLGSNHIELNAGTQAVIAGHVVGKPDFNGIVTANVFDVEETIVCKLNEPDAEGTDEPYQFKTRPNMIYTGSDSVRDGRFKIHFAVPKDISYSPENGQVIIYAASNDHRQMAHGQYSDFVLAGNGEFVDDGIGPSIYCYLNSSAFQNGGRVNTTPYFYAQLTDRDGINAAGSGIGHDLELVIDGEMQRTYNLNSYFQYDFGDYRSGTVGFSIPQLAEGPHKLLFRAWDVLNNPSTAELQFVVDASAEPSLIKVVCTKNPASSFTRFLISHDRMGSQMDLRLEVLDTSGRLLWQHTETAVPADETYAVDWDLTTQSGGRLRTGIYLYRVSVSSAGGSEASIAKKLIVVGNN